MSNLDVVTRLRPIPAPLDPAWSEATVARIMATRPDSTIEDSPGRRARRPVILGTAAALVLATATGSILAHPENAAAADLRVLAAHAATYDGPVLADGTWLHERTTSLQRNSATLGDGAVLDTDRETWTSWDGRTFLIERRPSTGRVEYDVLDDDVPPSYADPTPQFAATLPDTADGLLAYLRPRVTGSTTQDEALFEALTHLATSHTLPPRTLAAAFKALATIDHVTTEDAQVEGRAAVIVSYYEASTHSTQALTVDRASGQALALHNVSLQSDYESTTDLAEVVNGVPADVRAEFAPHAD